MKRWTWSSSFVLSPCWHAPLEQGTPMERERHQTSSWDHPVSQGRSVLAWHLIRPKEEEAPAKQIVFCCLRAQKRVSIYTVWCISQRAPRKRWKSTNRLKTRADQVVLMIRWMTGQSADFDVLGTRKVDCPKQAGPAQAPLSNSDITGRCCCLSGPE